MQRSIYILFLMIAAGISVSGQGNWNPPGFDPSFPRTLLDSAAILVVRASLSQPDHISLYSSIWNNANSVIPAGNTEILDRYYRAMIAREAAFVYLMDRKFVSSAIVPLTTAERDSMKARSIRLLEQLNNDVDVGTFWTFYNPWQYRSKELISYLVAWDLLRGAGIQPSELEAAKTRLLTFAANLYQKSMASYTFLNLKFFTYQINNHNIMTSSALGLAAIVFNDHSSSNVNYQPLNWINAGLYNLDNTLWMENGTYPRVSEPDTLAGYAEGPHYLRYGFENAFPFIRAMGLVLPDGTYPATFNGNTRNIRNLWYDPRYDRLYDWMNKIRMPDGSVPAIHDSYMGFGTVITALSGKPQFNWINPTFTADDPMIRSQYIATNVAHGAITDSLFQALPAAGSLVFRSSWNADATYMHFISKHGIALTGAKAHHQGDASSFSLAAYGKLLAIDPGYPGASLASATNKATDHNLILVNGSGPQPPSGETVSTSTNTAYIENIFDTPFLDYGEVRTNYQSTGIIRKNLFVDDTYFILADFLTASSSKSYTYQMHGYGLSGAAPTAVTGSFMPAFTGSSGVWTRDTVSLRVRVSTPGNPPSFSFETDSMAISGVFRKYTKMLVQKTAANTVFLSVLYPHGSNPPAFAPGSQNSQVTSVRITRPGFRELVFCSHAGIAHTLPVDSTGLNKVVKGNGKINFISESDSGRFLCAFLQAGDSLISDGKGLIRTGKKMDVVWSVQGNDLYRGYASDTGLIRLHSEVPLQPLQGSIMEAAYDTVNHEMVLTLGSEGNFLLGPADLTWEWAGMASADWHNAANWNWQKYPGIHGVPGAGNNVVIPGGTPNAPTISAQQPATCGNLTVRASAMLNVASMKFLTVGGILLIEGEPLLKK